MFTAIFKAMMAEGIMKKDDPEMLAVMYTAPVTSLIQLCTREPERQAEVVERCEAFFRYYIDTYVEK